MLNKKIKYITANILLVTLTFFFGCSGAMVGGNSGAKYIYTYSITEPAVNDQLLFKDDYITIQFSMDESAVKFQLQNISEVPISILWENVSIGLNNRVFAIRNGSTLYLTDQKHPLPVVIPSLGYVRDLVIPLDNIYLEKEKWVERDLFPANDLGSAARKKLIMKYIGSQIRLVLPIKVADLTQDYSFKFKVKNIVAVPANRLPPVKERPAVPQVSSSQASQSLLPIFIAGGILGLAIYAFSKQKADPLSF